MPPRRGDVVEVLIVGAGPAGATAALRLASVGRRVLLIDAARFPRTGPCAGWLSAQAGPLLSNVGVPVEDVVIGEFKSVAFYNADLTQIAYPNIGQAAGYLVDRATFNQQLLRTAVKAGAEFMDDRPVVDISIEERCVTLNLAGGESVCGRLLVMAAGQGSPLMERLGLTGESRSGASWIAAAQGAHPGFKANPSISVVLGLDQAEGFGTIITSEDVASVAVHLGDHPEEVVAHLVRLCRLAAKNKILHVDLSRQAATAAVTASPTAVALTMDTHVAKRTLIVGDAGGFVAAASGDGLYAAMWSASIACDVMLKALDSSSPQDTLMEFDAAWRMRMADYLRAPNTDTQYILPLVFSNQPMADRMGAAFFSGENL